MSANESSDTALIKAISWNAYQKKIHDIIVNIVYKQFLLYDQKGWEENQITTAIAASLASMGEIRIDNIDNELSLSWSAQRFNGKAEYERGDLGIAVYFKFSNNKTLIGYAHMEAKKFRYETDNNNKIDLDKGRFSELNTRQLEYHLKHTHAHYVLLYDVRNDKNGSKPNRKPFKALADTVISRHAVAINTQHRTIYDNSSPFSQLIVEQFLRGYGLDYGTPPEHVVRMWTSSLPTDTVLHAHVTVVDDRGEPYQMTSPMGGGSGGAAANIILN